MSQDSQAAVPTTHNPTSYLEDPALPPQDLAATHEQSEFDALMAIFPASIKKHLRDTFGKLEEVILDIGKPLHARLNTGVKYNDYDLVINYEHLRTVARKIGRFKDNGRTGIKGTLHRCSEKRDDNESLVGLTIRYGKHIYGVAELVKPYLINSGSMLVIGSPGKGKTTLLRDLVRIRAEVNNRQTCVCDSSGEIGGHDTVEHPCIGAARRFHVNRIEDQPRILTSIIQNHSPIDIIVDEMGYAKDVEIAERAARSGVSVIGTVHGEVILDLLENPVNYPLLGYPNKTKGLRQARPVFKQSLEVVDKGKYILYPDLSLAVDQMLSGDIPGGVRLGF